MRRPARWWTRRPRAAADPGERWAVEALEPLRRQEAGCDVVPRVMARIAAERRSILPDPVSPRAYRIAWASSLLLATASFAFLVSTLLVLITGGDEGVREIVRLGQSCWQVLVVFTRVIVELVSRALADILPFLRALWALLQVGAPLLRGAGTLAAAGGVLSILFSAYVFASARRTAPRLGAHGGT